VTGVPSWNVQPSFRVIVQVVLSSDSIDSATPVYSTDPSLVYSTSPVHSALTICEPSLSVVLPGTSGFSGW
jgi:hypothetical protein